MKQVIFIGSTSYSGSTFFDMTLGNDPAGFSCGEVYAYFHPFRPHHTNPECGCGNAGCEIWQQVKQNGEDRIFETIFDLNPDVEFIVDSSKDPFWIEQQTRLLRNKGIKVRNILIWKTPVELAESYKKRNIFEAWERTWVVYHRLYYSLVNDWRAVKYADYVGNPAVLKDICNYLDIRYFQGKERFWEKKHHLLFGNASARIHLDGQSGADDDELKDNASSELRQIYYRPVNDADILADVQKRSTESPYISKILTLLSRRDLSHKGDAGYDDPDLRMSELDVKARKIKQALGFAYGRFRFGS